MPTFTPPAGAVVRHPAPHFEATALMPDGSFGTLSLGDFKGKYVVLFFYPLDFTFVCPTEIIKFSEMQATLRPLGAEVVGCSVDSHFCHLAWTKTPRRTGGIGNMDIPLLADVSHGIAKAYGCYAEEAGVALRGLYIIDPKGVVRHASVNDLPVGRSDEEVVRLVQALKYTDTHGDAMPCGWRPGKRTMQADPVKSMAYFEAENAHSDAAGGLKRKAGDREGASPAKKVRRK